MNRFVNANVGLPEGWTLARLADATVNVANVKPEDEPQRVFGYVDISAIDNTTFQIVECKRFSGADAPSRARRPIEPEDVLFSNVRTYLRNIALVPDSLDAQLCSTGFTVLRTNGALDPRYLFRFTLTNEFIDAVTPQQTGTHYPATSDRVVLSQTIPLPPLAEQRRIVAKVEELLARVHAARERLAKAPTLLRRFRQAVLAAACSGQLTADWRKASPRLVPADTVDLPDSLTPDLPTGWRVTELSTLVEGLEQGWSPQCEIEPSPSPGIWGVIKTTAVQPLRFMKRENKRLPDGLSPREELELRAGDLLITRAGPRVRAGVACHVRSVRPRLIVCDKVYRFRAIPSRALAEFVALALNAPAMVELIDTLKTGISDSGVNLTQEKFLGLEITAPPVHEQREIVRRVDALFALADKIEARVQSAATRVEKITQAILAKAFRGELVPTEAELARQEGRDYEPASVLLERIRAERAADQDDAPRRPNRRAAAKKQAARRKR